MRATVVYAKWYHGPAFHYSFFLNSVLSYYHGTLLLQLVLAKGPQQRVLKHALYFKFKSSLASATTQTTTLSFVLLGTKYTQKKLKNKKEATSLFFFSPILLTREESRRSGRGVSLLAIFREKNQTFIGNVQKLKHHNHGWRNAYSDFSLSSSSLSSQAYVIISWCLNFHFSCCSFGFLSYTLMMMKMKIHSVQFLVNNISLVFIL